MSSSARLAASSRSSSARSLARSRSARSSAARLAAAFIAAVAREGDSAPDFDLNGSCETVEYGLAEIRRLVNHADVQATGEPLGFPPDLSDAPIRAHTGDYPSISVADGIAATHRAFTALVAEGRIDEKSIS